MINQTLVRDFAASFNTILFTKVTEKFFSAVKNRNARLLPVSAYFRSNCLKSKQENILAYKLPHPPIKAVSVKFFFGCDVNQYS